MTEMSLPTPGQFEEHLARFINESLLDGGVHVHRDTRLFEDGYITSLRVLDLIAVVEKTLGRRIPDRAVRLSNFRSIATIVQAFHPGAVEGTLAAAAAVGPDRLFERQGDRTRFTSPVAALEARGDLTRAGTGQVTLAGLALDVLRAVDHTVAGWARSLAAVERRYPTLIPVAVLERAGQAQSPSHHLTLAAHRDETAPRYALAPAVCYHTYPEWEGRTLGADPTVLTARGRCYRYEGPQHVGLERLWDFTMREIIVLGTRAQVETFRRSLIRLVADFVTALVLDGAIEAATDPFFTTADTGRRLMQQAGGLKYELRLTVAADGHAVAAASFNHHHDFFGTRFGIRLASGETAHTGCVAFGLERWVLALLAQHGADESQWPAAFRAWLDASRVANPAVDGPMALGATA